MKFENTEVYNFGAAIRGMRNPYDSWSKSDSLKFNDSYIIGHDDLLLMQKLIAAGPEHRKFMRQILISVDITAPLYWWKEFDTYKVGTVSNSCSTMHKLASTPITIDCFEYTADVVAPIFNSYVDTLEGLRKEYLETKNKNMWLALIQMLPESWLQKRTITLNYENVYSMIRQRRGHKLTEWSGAFIEWARSLPYSQELLFLGIK